MNQMKHPASTAPLLQLQDFSVGLLGRDSPFKLVKEVNLTVNQGEFHGLVGESGSGKSVTARGVLGILPPSLLHARTGRILFEGQDLLGYDEDKMRRDIRGKRISMVFQDPMTALNPVMKIGQQLILPILQHKSLSRAAAWEQAVALLDQVGIPNPRERMEAYPTQMSGGQRQRVMIAIALSCDPQLLIADEPTTALDVTVQAQILDLLEELRRERGLSVLLVSHDLSLIAERCDRVSTMYAGRVVESGPAMQMFHHPLHPYTRLLEQARPVMGALPHTPLQTIPGTPPRPLAPEPGCAFAPRCPSARPLCRELAPYLSQDQSAPSGPHLAACHYPNSAAVTAQEAEPSLPAYSDDIGNQLVLEARNLRVEYGTGQKTIAVDSVDILLRRGETLGLVGESGCGKSSIGRSLVQLPPPSSGSVHLSGVELTGKSAAALRPLRNRIQMIFQDPISSLNPRRTALEIVAEPLRMLGHADPKGAAMEALAKVGVTPEMAGRKPHQLSGGQCQRVSIARVVAQKPEVLVCDESVAALDVSVQAQVINILEKMKRENDLSIIFISHDLAVVNNISDRVAVMYLGRICEIAPSQQLYAKPLHHYTNLLLSSIPQPGKERNEAPAELRIKAAHRNCCLFAPRCKAASDICRSQKPELQDHGDGHFLACHHPRVV